MDARDMDMDGQKDAQRQAYLAGVRQELLVLRSRAADLLSLGVAESDGPYTSIGQRLEEAGQLLERMCRRCDAPDWQEDAAAMTSLCADVAARIGHLGADVHASGENAAVAVARGLRPCVG